MRSVSCHGGSTLKSKIIELGLENTEFIIDQTLSSGIIKDIPVIGNIYKLVTISESIRDLIYCNKLSEFLSKLESISSDKKEELKLKISNNPKEIEKASLKLNDVLDKITDIEKSEIICSIFVAYIDEICSREEFGRSLDIITNVFLDDLLIFLKTNLKVHGSIGVGSCLTITPTYRNLEKYTLLVEKNEEMKDSEYYKHTEFGKKMIQSYQYGLALIRTGS